MGLLRVFGWAAYAAHVAKDEHQKLDAKSKKCVLLSYGTERKGHRLYDPRCKRVFIAGMSCSMNQATGSKRSKVERKEQ